MRGSKRRRQHWWRSQTLLSGNAAPVTRNYEGNYLISLFGKDKNSRIVFAETLVLYYTLLLLVRSVLLPLSIPFVVCGGTRRYARHTHRQKAEAFKQTERGIAQDRDAANTTESKCRYVWGYKVAHECTKVCTKCESATSGLSQEYYMYEQRAQCVFERELWDGG